MSDIITRKQTLQNLLCEYEEKLRIDGHEYQCARLQFLETQQMVRDLRYLLNIEMKTFHES